MSSFSPQLVKSISDLIDGVLQKYLHKASEDPHSDSGNPFVLALLRDFEPLLHRIHGLKTSMGTELEKIAEMIAKDAWGEKNVNRRVNLNVRLPKNVFQTIDTIINNLSNSKKLPNYLDEKEKVISACKNPSIDQEEHTYEFDLQLYDQQKKNFYCLEMKGPDPNTTEVPGAKKRLLVMMAWAYLNKKGKNIDSIFSIYYNNKFPKPYKNPKVLYYFDPDGGLLVHDKFWNFIGKSETTYFELLKIFSDYGKKNKKKIWDGFSKLIKVENNK